MKTPLIFIICLGLCAEGLGHGRSEEMINALNAPVPSWMSLAKPIKVNPVEDQKIKDSVSFQPRSGGATNSRNRVCIPQRGIEIQVDYPIDWTGNNADGLGVSLSSDGTKLIVNSGLTSHLYEITQDGEHREIPIQIPHITYDGGAKGYITKWSWAGNDILVGRAGITDEPGHEIVEIRLYVFHLKEKALARLDLSALELDFDDPPLVEVVSVGRDLEHLVLNIEGDHIITTVDLKSPPQLLPEPDSSAPVIPDVAEAPSGVEVISGDQLSLQNAKREQSEEIQGGKNLWAWLFLFGGIAVLGVAVILVRVLLRGRAS